MIMIIMIMIHGESSRARGIIVRSLSVFHLSERSR